MAITSVKTGSSFTNLQKYDNFLGPNAAYNPSSFESIATVTATGSETLLSFTSIPGTYKSLQIRATARQSSGTLTTSAWLKMQFNSDTTAANYTMHGIQGTGAAAQGNWGFTSNGEITAYYVAGNSAASNIFGVGITDIIDYASTTKNKTVRSIGGNDQNGSGSIFLSSGLWVNTAAINRIDVYGSQTNSFAAGTTIALYGVK